MSNQPIWQKSYEVGVPVAIDPQRVVPLVEYLTATAKSHPEASAFTNFGSTIEYAELDRLSRRFSSGLSHQFHRRLCA